jgi:hypothetical protein
MGNAAPNVGHTYLKLPVITSDEALSTRIAVRPSTPAHQSPLHPPTSGELGPESAKVGQTAG